MQLKLVTTSFIPHMFGSNAAEYGKKKIMKLCTQSC